MRHHDITIEQAYRSIPWTPVVLIAAMFAVARDQGQRGGREDGTCPCQRSRISRAPRASDRSVCPHRVGQLISSTATVLIVIPIAISAASDIGVSSRPVLVSVVVSSAASFLTPIATPANMMVTGPAGYRFGDYWKLGLCMMAVFFVAATLLVPVIWPF